MNNRFNNIFSETDCLSPGILAAYAENKLCADDRFLVEKHLTDCGLCSDAVEGLLQLKDKSKLETLFAGINNDIDKRINKKEKKILRFGFRIRLAAAAILILITGVTFIFRHFLSVQKEEMIAQHTVKESEITKQERKEKEKSIELTGGEKQNLQSRSDDRNGLSGMKINEANENVSDDETIIPLNKPAGNTGQIQESMQQKSTPDFFRSAVKKVEIDNRTNNDLPEKTNEEDENYFSFALKDYKVEAEIMADSISITRNTEGKKLSEQPVTAVNNSALAKAGDQTNPKQKADKKSVTKSGTVAVPSQVNVKATGGATGIGDQRYATALDKYQAFDYDSSKELLESYIKDNPDDYNARYYYGVSCFFLNLFDNAIMYLEKVSANKNGSFFETARWYLALSNIGKKENKKAEAILNEIIKDSSSFKSQAEKKLLEIKK